MVCYKVCNLCYILSYSNVEDWSLILVWLGWSGKQKSLEGEGIRDKGGEVCVFLKRENHRTILSLCNTRRR